MSLVTETMEAQIGQETPSYQLRVEAQDMVRFARMLGHTEPWYIDEREARRSPFGGLIAVPTYLIVMRSLEHAAFAAIGISPPFPKGVDGGSSWKYFEPIRAGDMITATAKVSGYKEQETALGDTLFQSITIHYRNQFGDLAVSQLDTRIFYK
jgi:acyl dehydratase